MSAERWQRLRRIFNDVLDSDHRDREQKLNDLCAGDPGLRDEIRGLLSAAEISDTFLDTPATGLLRASLHPGLVLLGRFELVSRLGRGGMGDVWRARDRQLREDVAIKTIGENRVGDVASLGRFKREIQLARKVAHPNVCRVYDLFEDATVIPPRVFLTMEFLVGETLSERIKRDGPIARDETLAMFNQISAGVAAAHHVGVVHRDLKPANVMLCGTGADLRAVVMDFGLARAPASVDGGDSQTVSGAVVGTPEYMAPEQIGGTPATPATDVYALGLLLFEMLSGTRPYAGGTTFESWMRRAREGPRKLSGAVPGVQRRIDEVIARCLEYEPAKRYRDASEIGTALQSPWPFVIASSRKPAVAIVGVVAVASMVVAGLYVGERLIPIRAPSADAVKWNADAQTALAEGASVRAMNDVNRAIESSPRFAAAYATLAEVLLDLDMPGRAQETMLQITDVAPDRSRLSESDAVYITGVQQLLLRNCESAVQSMQRFAQLTGGAERTSRLLALARVLERCDRPDDAMKALSDAATLDTRNPAIALRQSRILASRQKYAEAFVALTQAETLFRDRNNTEGLGEVLATRGTFEQQQERLDDAEATLAKAADVARSLDDVRQQVRVSLQRAIVRRKRGDIAAADRLTTDSIDLARRRGLETLTVESLFAAANVHLVANDYTHARELFERALTIADTYRHDEYRARAQLSLASVLSQAAELDAAFKNVEAARLYYVRIGHRRNVALADTLRGRIRMQRAQYAEAAGEFETTMKQAQAAGDLEQETLARENLATALTGAGRLPEALAQYKQALEAHQRSGRKRAAAYALLNVADLASRLGDFEAGDEAVARAASAAIGDARALIVRVHRVKADMALRRGRYQVAANEAHLVLNFEEGRSPSSTARARQNLCLAEARVAARDRERATCEALLNSTPKQQTELWLENRIAVAEARFLRGDRTGTEALVKECLTIIEEHGAHHEYWRLLALQSAVRRGAQNGLESQQRLTRELEKLRLNWGEAAYNGWLRRTDVRTLLAAGGVRGDER